MVRLSLPLGSGCEVLRGSDTTCWNRDQDQRQTQHEIYEGEAQGQKEN